VPPVPWLIVQGDRDELVEHATIVAWAEALSPAPAMVTIAGAEHFFHGRLQELKDAVQDFLGP